MSKGKPIFEVEFQSPLSFLHAWYARYEGATVSINDLLAIALEDATFKKGSRRNERVYHSRKYTKMRHCLSKFHDVSQVEHISGYKIIETRASNNKLSGYRLEFDEALVSVPVEEYEYVDPNDATIVGHIKVKDNKYAPSEEKEETVQETTNNDVKYINPSNVRFFLKQNDVLVKEQPEVFGYKVDYLLQEYSALAKELKDMGFSERTIAQMFEMQGLSHSTHTMTDETVAKMIAM